MIMPRALRGLAIAIALTAMACADAAPGGENTAEASGYAFEDVSVRTGDDRDADSATIGWDVRWTSEAFPGVRRCTWTAVDETGNVVGSATDRLTIMQPVAEDLHISIPVTSRPSSATISCDPERLDVGEPYRYAFTDVEPVVRPESDRISVRYQARWEGPEAPGPVTCLAEVTAGDGERRGATQVTIYLADGRGSGEVAIPATGSTEGPPTAAVVTDCRPFDP
jgi:hypothetical protein